MVELVPTLREFNQFEARLYDVRIMRWNVPDPAGQYWSPYLGMGNDPMNRVDPDGERDWPRWRQARKNAKVNENYLLTGNVIPELTFVGQSKTGFARFGNYLSNNWNMNSSKYDLKISETIQYSDLIINPLGETIVTNWSTISEGKGQDHINIINPTTENRVEYSKDMDFAIGSIRLKPNGFTASVGGPLKVHLGLSTDGLTIGSFTVNGDTKRGTSYTWKPSKKWWVMATAPVPVFNGVPIIF